ncbi:hypothetical protein C1S99_10745 [Vibrio parahaemolyticus]|uniref:hypothetical protein n=1 Tax=Vibrio parahaemolyticus TaxID=670 RepID=UPI0005320490|nr:hypothetical protein [Vibrio parahaemolyticus]EJB8688803.1 hypothetical protein [Vibrio parahaemolyticus]KGT35590.1 hypothetical protein HC02_04050 [Vibrio parahaemolyticus]MDG2564393.1 hypothetical protein [Vibrio parahaemolyticus]PMS42187.1 hypothetical protein C1T12_11230 [Vibrio parahaemolyticus]PMS62247.1 hypothetical protein C1S91_15475 [Vibrio parahaemolyticus]
MHKVVRVNRDLIEASVEDAKLTLECVLNQDPHMAKNCAQHALELLPMPKRTGMMPSQMTRIAMLRTIIKRADKLLAKSK